MVRQRGAPAPGDILIIASFAVYNESEIARHEPQLIYVDTQNRIVRMAGHIPAQVAA
jgi:aspartate 1-decarboxylase